MESNKPKILFAVVAVIILIVAWYTYLFLEEFDFNPREAWVALTVIKMEENGKFSESFPLNMEYCEKGKMDWCSNASNNRLRVGDYEKARELGHISCEGKFGGGCYNLACALCLLGKKEEAWIALEKSYHLKKATGKSLTDNHPEADEDLKCLWDDPRFKELLQKAQLDQPQK